MLHRPPLQTGHLSQNTKNPIS
ncbi:uncharacterized protein FFFS_16027 [Fusarium fujikuroi]|nr:uncharacterized protein FFFS_16027 [Fusarium fujikuroi]